MYVSVCVCLECVCLGVGCMGAYKDLKTDNIQNCCRGHLKGVWRTSEGCLDSVQRVSVAFLCVCVCLCMSEVCVSRCGVYWGL